MPRRPGAATARRATAPAATASRILRSHVLIDCSRRPVVTPTRFVIACADANDYLARLHWYVWSTAGFASGVEWINDCRPDCARGHFHRFPVLVTVWRAERLARTRLFNYTRMTILYLGALPFHTRTRTIDL